MNLRTGPLPFRLVDGREAASRATRLRVRARIGLARAIDAAAARAGAARPAILVSGFWRSGTTWLQECLAEMLHAKTVFEPLSPLNPVRGAALARRFPGDEDAAQAHIPDRHDADAAFWAILDGAMAGVADSPFTLSCRWSVREGFRRAVVVKDVRLQCHLEGVHARYGVSVVHLRRHPCAVVSSLMQANWHWSFARVRLGQLVSGTEPDDAGGCHPARFDGDALSRIAACWAWSERRAAATLASKPWGRVITYEDLARDPAGLLAATCAGFGLRPKSSAAFDRPSASIHPDEFASRASGTGRWRQTLPAEDAERVERVATAVYPRWREAWSDG